MIDAVHAGSLTLEKLEAMTCVCSVGLDMIAIPGDTPATTISGVIADEMAIGKMCIRDRFKCLFPTKHYFLVIFQQSVYSRFRRSQSNQRLRSSHAGSQLCGSAVHCRLLLTEVQQSVIYRCSYIPWNVREHQHHG